MPLRRRGELRDVFGIISVNDSFTLRPSADVKINGDDPGKFFAPPFKKGGN